MTRRLFGGGAGDTVARVVAGNYQPAQLAVSMWSARTSGSQVTDLLDVNSNPITTVSTDIAGQLPVFSGPDGVGSLWADAGGGVRSLLLATDDSTYFDARYNATYVPVTQVLDASYSSGSKLATLLASAAAGSVFEVPAGVTLTPPPQTLSSKITIKGQGTLSDTRSSPTGAFITIPPAASGSQILCKLVGAVGGTYVANHHAIAVQGTDNGAATPPTYVTDVVLKPGEISGFGSIAVFGEFVQNATIDIDNCHNMGFSGILIHSAGDVSARIRNLHDLTPGTAGSSYALQFDRRDATSDLVRYPHSKNSYGYVDVMRNVLDWDGLGTHGGQGIYLGFGVMFGVRRPIDVVAATGDSGVISFAPNDIVIDLGKADSGVTNGTYGPAVNIAGAFKGTDTLGSPTEYAKGVVVKPGMIRGYGIDGDLTTGAFYCHSTQGLVLDAGVVREASPYAITMYHDNKDFVIKGVLALDPWASTSAIAGVVNFNSTFNTGWILSASATTGSKSATHVNNRGLNVAVDATNVVKVGVHADFSSASTPIAGPVATPFGLVLLGPDGAAATPAFSFASDPDTGIYHRTTNDLGLVAGGTVTAHVTATTFFLNDGAGVSVGTTTGSTIAAGASQKLGFWGKTPIVQPSGTPAAATDLASVITLANAIRTALLNAGLIA